MRTKIKSAHNYLFKDLNNLDEGNFIWTLQESSDSEEEGKIRPKTTIPFKIYLSNKPEAPKIKTPEKFMLNKLLSAILILFLLIPIVSQEIDIENPILTWEAIPNANGYQLQIRNESEEIIVEKND